MKSRVIQIETGIQDAYLHSLPGAFGAANGFPYLADLQQAGGAGQGLASSLNIAAFNLGNAFGAWLGGAVITQGLGYGAIAPVAAVVPLLAFGLAVVAVSLERRASRIVPACAT